MGSNGADILLSTRAKEVFPYKVEAKSLASAAIYRLYDQANSHDEPGEPLLILKANRRKPLAIVDAEYFLQLVSKDQ